MRPLTGLTGLTRLTALTGLSALALALLACVALAHEHDRFDVWQHPVWGPALAAEAAAVATDAPARSAAELAVQRSAQGLSGWAQLRPGVAWRSRAPDATASLSVGAGVRWLDDPVAVANALLDQHRGDVAAHERALRALRSATSAWIDLRRAHLAVELAAARLPDRQAALERAEAGLLAGRVSGTQRDVAALELERAHEAVARASRDLAAARHVAAQHGIDVAAAAAQHHAVLRSEPLEGWRLPEPPPDLPHEALRRRELERDLAAARLAAREVWAVLDDVRLEGSYSESGTRLRAGGGLDRGRPTVWADVNWTGSGADAWSVSLSARLRIDDSWELERRRAERILSEAEAALDAAVAEAGWQATEARRALAEAEADVAFAERALALGRAALRDLGEELAEARAELRAAERLAAELSTAELDAVEAEARVRRFEDVYRRAELGHQRERDAFLRAWERYLREAERLWAGVGWPFNVTVGGDVGE